MNNKYVATKADNFKIKYYLIEKNGVTSWQERNDALGPRGRPWTENTGHLGYWVGSGGGGFGVSESDKILDIREVEDDAELPWSTTATFAIKLKEDALSGRYTAGWLSPEGVFYGCAYMEHDDLAFYVIGKRVSELEDLGWLRVHDKDYGVIAGGWNRVKQEVTEPNEIQAKVLLELDKKRYDLDSAKQERDELA